MARHTKGCDYSVIRETIYTKIANDANTLNKQKNFTSSDGFNPNLMSKGSQWFESGCKLEDAPDELKNNRNFQNGFNRAKRLADVAEYQYNLGIQYAIQGLSLEQIPEKDRNSIDVIKGYEDGMKTEKSK